MFERKNELSLLVITKKFAYCLDNALISANIHAIS